MRGVIQRHYLFFQWLEGLVANSLSFLVPEKYHLANFVESVQHHAIDITCWYCGGFGKVALRPSTV